MQNVRYALRQLRRAPGYALVAIGTLALGIGANAAIFSLVEAALLRGLPFREPERLVALWERSPRGNARNQIAGRNFVRWRERVKSFESLSAFASWPTTLAGADDAVRVPMGIVMPGFFDTFGVAPLAGRWFVEADHAPGAPNVTVLSESLWRRRFGGDQELVGRSITVDGRPALVVGIMPARFDLPAETALWFPITMNEDTRKSGRFLGGVGRLRPGVSLEDARAEMDLMAANLAVELPQNNTGWGVTVTPLSDDLVTAVRPQLLLLMAGVALLLFMACVNVSGLMLSRALTRAREFAIRTAIGAGRGELVRQLLTESLVLCTLGGAAGLVLGQWALAALTASLPGELPAFMAPRMGWPVIAFAFAVCALAAGVTGVIPALRLAGVPLLPALREGDAGSGVGAARRRTRGLLVAGQMAIALVLVAGGGLLLRSYVRLSGVDAGFDPRGVLALDIALPDATYEEPARQTRFFDEAVASLSTVPGVASAAGISWLPFGLGSATDFRALDRPEPLPGQEPGGDVRFVTPGLFRTLGIPIKEGRDFTADDRAGRPGVVIVNETLARAMWPGESALGKRIAMEWDTMLEATVIGVVGDVKMKSLATSARNTLYWPHLQAPTSFMSLVVKSSGSDPASLMTAATSAVRTVDRGVAVEAQPLPQYVAATLQQQSFTLALTMGFALTAIALAAVGLFGVVGQAVGERRREFALRIALGARRDDIRRLVLGEGFRWTTVGVAVGLPAAILAGRALGSFLFEVSPFDPVTYGAVLAVLAGSALVAVMVPAWRAARVDPLVVLRAD